MHKMEVIILRMKKELVGNFAVKLSKIYIAILSLT